MSGTSKFLTLLTATYLPISLILRPCCFLHRRSVIFARYLSSSPRLLTVDSFAHFSPTRAPVTNSQRKFHSEALPVNSNNAFSSSPSTVHPWPEWCNLINAISASRQVEDHGAIPEEDAFVAYEQLPDDFVRAAIACLAFARQKPNLLGSLSKRDMEVVVSNGTPFLFRTALETARRMRAFLGIDGNHALDRCDAHTVDIMKYILSYASNPAGSPGQNTLYSRELLETSIRNLLHELVEVSILPPPHQFSGRAGQNIVMKRGDWICPKCSFMNFARNMKCLECEEPRPRRQLTGGEWECPKCDFLNYGRNVVCLRCDSKRPSKASFNSVTNSSADEDLPEIIPLRKGDNKFAVSTRKTKGDSVNHGFPEEKGKGEKPERWFQKMAELHDFKDLPNGISDDDFPEIIQRKDHSLTSPTNKRQVAMEQATDFVPFVPFPPGFFATKGTQSPDNPSCSNVLSGGSPAQLEENQNQRSGWTGKSLEGSAVKEPDPLDMSEEAKTERWYRRVAQIKDISELSQIPDEDFPSIMPMRKGVNRFVVSKRKTPLERRLMSAQYNQKNFPVVSSDPMKRENDDIETE